MCIRVALDMVASKNAPSYRLPETFVHGTKLDLSCWDERYKGFYDDAAASTDSISCVNGKWLLGGDPGSQSIQELSLVRQRQSHSGLKCPTTEVQLTQRSRARQVPMLPVRAD